MTGTYAHALLSLERVLRRRMKRRRGQMKRSAGGVHRRGREEHHILSGHGSSFSFWIMREYLLHIHIRVCKYIFLVNTLCLILFTS